MIPPPSWYTGEDGRLGRTENSLVCGGCIVCGGVVRDSILGRNVFIQSGAEVENCIILDNCRVAHDCRLRRTILDKNVCLEPDTVIGYDRAEDSKRYFVTETGIVVVSGGRTPVEISKVAI